MNTLKYPLTNAQAEFLKLLGTDLSDKDLDDLKSIVSRFFADRAIKKADELWDKKGMSDDDMDRLLNEQR